MVTPSSLRRNVARLPDGEGCSLCSEWVGGGEGSMRNVHCGIWHTFLLFKSLGLLFK